MFKCLQDLLRQEQTQPDNSVMTPDGPVKANQPPRVYQILTDRWATTLGEMGWGHGSYSGCRLMEFSVDRPEEIGVGDFIVTGYTDEDKREYWFVYRSAFGKFLTIEQPAPSAA